MVTYRQKTEKEIIDRRIAILIIQNERYNKLSLIKRIKKKILNVLFFPYIQIE